MYLRILSEMDEMKRRKIAFLMVALITIITLVSCSGGKGETVTCYNGKFTGTTEAGINVFKGIPYAKAPTGNLRWKAPEPAEASSKTFDATAFGKSSIQSKADSEEASKNKIGEDCLTLNVWTKDVNAKKKAVMFFIHGGAYGWGGTSDSLYDGKNIVKEHDDVVVVTCNYRVNIMGFADFSQVEGGENYSDSGYLGVLDIIQGLKWVQQNIEAFGGDPDNVTIFGESAGAGMVSSLMIVKEAKGLFHRAIAESGSVNFTSTHEDFARRGQVEKLMKLTGAENMDDLIAIPEKTLIKLLTNTEDEKGKLICDYFSCPLRGDDSIIPADPYQAYEDGIGSDIDFINGTNADEQRYFIDDLGKPSLLNIRDKNKKDKEATKRKALFSLALAQSKLDRVMDKSSDEEKANIQKCLELHKNKKLALKGEVSKLASYSNEDVDAVNKIYASFNSTWQNTEIINETEYRIPAIEIAYRHAKAGGNTYMYNFGKKNTNFDWIGACHASELAYVFHNLDNTHFTGKVDKGLADKMCEAWVNFAKTGNPGTDAMKWTKYTPENRETLVINDDCTTKMVNDYRSEERKLLGFTYKFMLK